MLKRFRSFIKNGKERKKRFRSFIKNGKEWMPNPGFAWKKMCFLPCLKAKIKEKQKKQLFRSKTVCPFLKKKKNFKFYFWWLLFEVFGRFLQKKFVFKDSCDFLKMKIGWNCRFFEIEDLKINLIDSLA